MGNRASGGLETECLEISRASDALIRSTTAAIAARFDAWIGPAGCWLSNLARFDSDVGKQF
jgi:hypothetical protein